MQLCSGALLLLLATSQSTSACAPIDPAAAVGLRSAVDFTEAPSPPSHHLSSRDSMKVYSRIAFIDWQDHERIFSLLVDFIQHPEHAAAVEEFAFDPEYLHSQYAWMITDRFRNCERDILEKDTDFAQYAPFQSTVANLGLDDSEAVECLRTLRGADPRHSDALKAASQSEYTNPCGPVDLKHLRQMFLHYAAMMLLALCPNIRTIVLGAMQRYPYRSPLQNFLHQNNYDMLPQKYLQKLQTVRILPDFSQDTHEYTRFDFLTYMALFHHSPALQSVSVNAVEDVRDDFLEEFPPKTTNVTKLSIGNSAYGSLILGAIIRVPRALEELTIQTGGLSTRDGSHNTVHPMTLGKALHDHKSSLRKLDIDLDARFPAGWGPVAQEDFPYDNYGGIVEDDENWWLTEERESFLERQEAQRDELWHKDLEMSTLADKSHLRTWDMPTTREYGYTIGSLHDFYSLTHLSIGIKFLLAGTPVSWATSEERKRVHEAPFKLVDALPIGLESLTLRGYTRGENPYYDWHVDEFLKNKEARFPNLTEVRGVEETIPNARDTWVDNDVTDIACYRREVVDPTWVEADK
ncbi:hypothetical protein HJFPF1_11012 [Paramyrothecium foliicola]|nr:hypothetical protein HJFPF1_11012 [Paramyrothecium foliicola]